MVTERRIPISRLLESEAQTFRLLSLVKDMSKILRDAPVDGALSLVQQAEAIEAGIQMGGSLTSKGLLAAVKEFLAEYEPPTTSDPETGTQLYSCCEARVTQGHVPSCPFWALNAAAIREQSRLNLKSQ